ncbi:MAG: GIY-YIG nuclease family protein [Deltaproteobacteria bacterium]|nr:GIY-YIG nuclease family protein [Deltaproteobacteria bacterium]
MNGEKQFYVYLLASKRNGTLYIGVTSDLVKRLWQHKNKMVEGFTEKYNVNRLVYYETHANAENAITREKQMKKWRRAWKIRLIEEKNPYWKDMTISEFKLDSPPPAWGQASRE